MVRKNWLCAVIGLGLVACGGGSDDDDEDSMNPAGGNTGGTSSGGTSPGQTGGTGGTGGTTGAATGGTSTGGTTGATTGGASCQPPGQSCTCTNGDMGFQTCSNGVLGECMCLGGIDAGPERPCPTGLTCRALGGGGQMLPGLPAAVCTNGMSPLPPMCTTEADCTTAGFVDVPCMSIGGFLNLCVQACTP
jgi:hypothetical protein